MALALCAVNYTECHHTAASKHRFALQIRGDVRRLIASVYFIALLDGFLLSLFTSIGIALFELLPIKGQVLSDSTRFRYHRHFLVA